MKPGHILPHPDAPDSFILMKAPPGMTNCVDLAYRLVALDGDQSRLAIVAEFSPEPAEIELLAAGQPLRFMMHLLMDGDRPIVPPVAMWVREKEEV